MSKSIELSDEDYKDLIEMINEIKTQGDDSLPNPRMWTVDTTHERVCKESYSNYDGIKNGYSVVSSQECTSIRLGELKEKLLKSYKTYGSLDNLDDEYETYIDSIDKFTEWCSKKYYTILDVLENKNTYTLSDYLYTLKDIDVVPIEEYNRHELNATFFKSDAKTHIEWNKHNLGKNPHPYAFTVCDMPKMERLFTILNSIKTSEEVVK